MARTELDLKPVEFITIGTIGPKGRRIFHLQAGYEGQIITFIIEKEQANALGEALMSFIEELDQRLNVKTDVEMAALDMDLREPIQPMFRISQMGLAYDEDEERVILIAEQMSTSEDEDENDIVRMWCTREQMYALSIQAIDTVKAGRPGLRQNGRILYYWQ
ncbi:MAG: DUF3090 family protein [Anaerolineae bacterium]|nr:DUF3090 family protein [Anaerolineae bacterium]